MLDANDPPTVFQAIFGISQTTMNTATLTCNPQVGSPVTATADAMVVVLNPAVQITKRTDDKVVILKGRTPHFE